MKEYIVRLSDEEHKICEERLERLAVVKSAGAARVIH